MKKFEQDQTCMIDQKNCAIHTHNWQGGKHCLTTTIWKRRRQRDKNLENIDNQSLPASRQLKILVLFLQNLTRNIVFYGPMQCYTKTFLNSIFYLFFTISMQSERTRPDEVASINK